jgi:YidC/Oxa1 family membrane protein insertase
MNNKPNMLFIIVMMTATMLLIQFYFKPQQQQNVQKPNPTVLLEKADKETKSRDYKAAIKSYDYIAGEFKGSDYAAKALFRKAEILKTGPDKFKNERGALDTYKSLVKDYDATKFPEAARAKQEEDALRKKMDTEASKTLLYKVLDAFVRSGKSLYLGAYSYAFALLLITLIVKVITWPLSSMQYKGMRDMQRVQPLLKEVQEKYKDKPKELNAKVMETYKKEGVNPLMGCLPMLIQFPVLIFVYRAIISYEFQFQNGVFLWIGSGLSHKFSFIGANLAQPDIPLVVLYTISMFITQRLTVVDPTQAQQQKMMTIMMPLMFAFFFWRFASAFLLYWLMLNIVMTAHQYYVMKSGTPALVSQVVQAAPLPSRQAKSRSKRKK